MDNGWSNSSNMVYRLDAELKVDLIVLFDPEDTDAAVAELDRLHAEIEADDS